MPILIIGSGRSIDLSVALCSPFKSVQLGRGEPRMQRPLGRRDRPRPFVEQRPPQPPQLSLGPLPHTRRQEQLARHLPLGLRVQHREQSTP